MSDVRAQIAILFLSITTVACFHRVNYYGRDGDKTPTEARERISPEQQIITAHHEAAHAVFDMALLPKRGVSKLQVFSKVNEEEMSDVHLLGLMTAGDGPMQGDAAYQHRALALISLAGAAAEEILFNETPPTSDSDSDSSAFQSLAYCEAAHCECPPESQIDGECLMSGLLKPERERLYAEAKVCAEANKIVIIKLAKLVILKDEDTKNAVRALSKEELDAFFGANPLNVEACVHPKLPPTPAASASDTVTAPSPYAPLTPLPPW